MATTLWVNCNNALEWKGVQDLRTKAYISTATITYTITGTFSAGGQLTGTLNYLAGSLGDYEAIFLGNTLIPGNNYTATLSLTTSAPSNYNDTRVITFTAMTRQQV